MPFQDSLIQQVRSTQTNYNSKPNAHIKRYSSGISNIGYKWGLRLGSFYNERKQPLPKFPKTFRVQILEFIVF